MYISRHTMQTYIFHLAGCAYAQRHQSLPGTSFPWQAPAPSLPRWSQLPVPRLSAIIIITTAITANTPPPRTPQGQPRARAALQRASRETNTPHAHLSAERTHTHTHTLINLRMSTTHYRKRMLTSTHWQSHTHTANIYKYTLTNTFTHTLMHT